MNLLRVKTLALASNVVLRLELARRYKDLRQVKVGGCGSTPAYARNLTGNPGHSELTRWMAVPALVCDRDEPWPVSVRRCQTLSRTRVDWRQHPFRYAAVSQGCFDWPVRLVWKLAINTLRPLVTVSCQGRFFFKIYLIIYFAPQACLA